MIYNYNLNKRVAKKQAAAKTIKKYFIKEMVCKSVYIKIHLHRICIRR